MSARYRRGKVTRGQSAAAAAASIALGAGVAAAAFYVARLLLARVPLTDRTTVERLPTAPREALAAGREENRDSSRG